MTKYRRAVFGRTSMLISLSDGTTREPTPKEWENLREIYDAELERSFIVSRTHDADEPGHLIEGDDWPHLNLGPPK